MNWTQKLLFLIILFILAFATVANYSSNAVRNGDAGLSNVNQVSGVNSATQIAPSSDFVQQAGSLSANQGGSTYRNSSVSSSISSTTSVSSTISTNPTSTGPLTSSASARRTFTTSTQTQTTSATTENHDTTSTRSGGRRTSTIATITSSTVSTKTTTTKITSSTSTLSGQTVTASWDPYSDFYSFLNYGIFNDGGDCYGFTSSAILYFMHYGVGDQTFPYYPQAAVSLSSLTGDTDSNTLSQSTFPIYIHQTYDPNNRAFVPADQQAEAQLLMQGIQEGEPVTLIIGPTSFHAIVAWGYTKLSDGSMVIDVSDPNFGNEPRYATYQNGIFSYTGTDTWTTFRVVTPQVLQWIWFSSTSLASTVSSTNDYYNYVFSNYPITIVASSGVAYFGTLGDTLSFTNSISGVVGFEEGSMQVYGIPKSVPYTIQDPGENASMITIVIPQNQTSIVGYELSSSSSKPLNMSIIPTNDRINVVTSNDVSISISFFSAGITTRSIFNTTSILVASTQTAVFSVPDWSGLNNSQFAPSLQVLESNGEVVTSHTLTNVQSNSSTTGAGLAGIVPYVIVSSLVVLAVLVFLIRRGGKEKQR